MAGPASMDSWVVSLYALRRIESGSLPPCVPINIVFQLAKRFSIKPSRVFSPDLFA